MSSNQPKKAVFVIGAGRSGTSTLTRALQALGVDLGQHFKKASRKNPKGFFEDADLLAISKKARRVLGLRADSVRWLAPGAFDNPKLQPLQDQAIQVINKRFGHSPVWGFKYGRTLRILPFWDRVLAATQSQPCFVIALRNPISVARSRAKIDPRRGTQAASDLEWLMSIVPFLRHTRAHPLSVVDYDDLMDHPHQTLSRVSQTLGLVGTSDGADTIQSFIDEFLDQRLRHSKFSEDDLDQAADLNPIVKDAYGLLRQRADTENRPGGDDAFWVAWEAIEQRVMALKPVLALIDEREAQWRRAITHPLGPLQAWALIRPWFKQ